MGDAASLSFLDIFAGIGGMRRGLETAGHCCVGYIEWDKYARKSYESIFNTEGEWTANDVTTVSAGELPRADIWTFGFPCFAAGTLVTTSDGVKQIEDVTTSDAVLTHNNRFRSVVRTMKHRHTGIYRLKVQGSHTTYVTSEHPYYVREMKRVWDNDSRVYRRMFSEPVWKEVKDLGKSDFIGFALNTQSDNRLNLTKEECYLLGRYVADGYVQDNLRAGRQNSHSHKVIFCVGKSKRSEFISNVHDYTLGCTEERTAFKFRIISERLMNLCKQCGRGAKNKRIPGFVMDLPVDMLEIFLTGYMDGDGCYTNGQYKATSISRELVYQLGQVVQKVYRVPYSIYFSKRPDQTAIEGRTVNQHDSWSISFQKEIRKQNNATVIDGVLWCPIKEIEYDDTWEGDVYNFEVKDDNSYVANNCTVHNCQDLSIAGKQRGFTGERSSLFFTVVQLLRETEERDRPEWLIAENVMGLFSSNRGYDFLATQVALDEVGYDIEWDVFNAVQFGIPQNRNRIFIVGHLRSRGRRKVFPLGVANTKANCVLAGRLALPGKDQWNRVYSPTLTTMQGGRQEPKVVINHDARGGISISETVGTLRANSHGNHPMVEVETKIIIDDTQGFDGVRVYENEAPTIRSQRQGLKTVVSAVLTPDREEKRQNGRRVNEPDEPMFTLTEQHGVMVSYDRKNGVGEELDVAHTLSASDWRGLNRNQTQNAVMCVGNTNPSGNGMNGNVFDAEGLAPTLTTNKGEGNKILTGTRIRKLTPLECWRLMGREDWEFQRAKDAGVSDSQLYKQAGNSLIPQIVAAIGKRIAEVTA